MSDKGVMGMAGDEPIRLRFPTHVTVLGIAAVLIPEADYRALIERTAVVARGGRLTHLDKEPEVRDFILERVGTDDLDRIRATAIERFGVDRVPSRSAVNWFIVRTRAQAGARNRKRPA